MLSRTTSSTVCRRVRRPAVAVLAAAAVGCAGNPTGPDLGELDVRPSRIQAGTDFTCFLANDARVWCAGVNTHGQLGDATKRDRDQLAPIQSELRFEMISTQPGGEHVCGVTEGGDVYCWGENDFGQVGDGTQVDKALPARVQGDLQFRLVSAGWRFTCGIVTTGAAYCWGRGEWGQLGDGRIANSSTPVPVASAERFASLTVGSNNIVCGVTEEAELFCWGLNFGGAVGAETSETCTLNQFSLPCAPNPVRVAPGVSFKQVAAGQSYACAITLQNETMCWGSNTAGQLGTDQTVDCPTVGTNSIPCSPTPIAVSGSMAFVNLAAGLNHTCAINAEGEAYCWGDNEFGQRGDGLLLNGGSTPVAVRGGLSFAQLSAGNNHTCGETTNGVLYCWGANYIGQLATNNRNLELTPALVAEGR